MERLNVCRISCEIHESLQEELTWVLGQLGIREVLVQAARSAQLLGNGGVRSLMGKPEALRENPYTVVSCYVSNTLEIPIMQYIIRACGLDMTGRGSLFSSAVTLHCNERMADNIRAVPQPRSILNPVHLQTNLMGISCIVQRNSGNALARLALSLGTCVPIITFGEGTGLRDKLGLMRITIPAAKEVVHLAVPDHDAQGIVEVLVEEAKLNQPGKGFVSVYPIRNALLNTRLQVGRQSHAASMEQVIGAIDHLSGSTQWRRRFEQNHGNGRLTFMKDRFSVQCINDEGSAHELARAAMSAGAGGATTTVLKYQALSQEFTLAGDPAKDLTTMVLADHLVEGVCNALLEAGRENNQPEGFVEIQPCPLAFTYQHQKR